MNLIHSVSQKYSPQSNSWGKNLASFLIRRCGLRHLHGSKTSKLIRSVLNEIDLQYIRDTHPCPSFHEREQMYKFVNDAIQQEAIDYIEFGVFQGATIRFWADSNKHQESRFIGFDSFEGLPEDWRPSAPKGRFNVDGALPEIDDPRVHFVKGWFDTTIPLFTRKFEVKNRLVVHLDADLYGSTMLALVHLAPFFSKGTLLIFDEFFDRDHEFKALIDWQSIYRKDFRIIAETGNFAQVCAELI